MPQSRYQVSLPRLDETDPQVDDGPMLVGAAAFAAVWGALPGLRLLGVAARWRPVAWLLERAYDAFLRCRPRLQALAARWL